MKKWIVVGSATGINLILGLFYVWSVISKALIKELHWTSVQASLPYTICGVVFAVFMIFSGRLQDIKGPRLGATFGGILFGLGLIISSFVQSPGLMVLSFGVLTGAGIAFSYASTTPPSVKWFPLNKKGVITGLVVAGVGFAGVYISPLTSALIKGYGINQTFLIVGVASLIFIVVFAQFLANPPSDVIKANHNMALASTGNSSGSKQVEWKDMLKTLKFYQLWLMYAFTASAGLMIIGHLAIIAVKQAKWENGYYLVALLAIFNTLGRIIAGIVTDKIGYTKTMRIIFFLQAINVALFSFYTSPALLAVGAAVTGLCYGALFSIFPTATVHYFGAKNLGVNYGLIYTAWGIAGVIGPLSAARIVDVTGSYNTAYVVSATLLVIAGLLTIFMRSRAPRATQSTAA